jgi:prolyl oligopeptidase PreP (S9A serine peptidase family)
VGHLARLAQGGHGGAADNKQRAYMWSLSYEFLDKALGIGGASL